MRVLIHSRNAVPGLHQRRRLARETTNATSKKMPSNTHIHHGLGWVGVLGRKPPTSTAAVYVDLMWTLSSQSMFTDTDWFRKAATPLDVAFRAGMRNMTPHLGSRLLPN